MRPKIFFIFFVSLILSTASAFAKVQFGIDVLQSENFKPLFGAHVGLITNQTGVDKSGDSTVDIFHKTKKLKLKCILTPEHGFRGEVGHGQNISDSVDPKTGVRIYSLYGKTSRPTADMLKSVNTLVFDIQDIGTRFYTYITTMAMAMEEAAKLNIRFVVLDRPNPIRGDMMEGDVLDPDIKRMTGYFQVPVRHGLTVGELAQWINKTQNINARLTVIKMKNWKRSLWYDGTHRNFIPPSPNIPNLNTALLYSGIGCFEATNISVGRGTPTPFEIIGAPWVDSKALCSYLREKQFPGILFEETDFIPENDAYQNEVCHGVRMIVTDRNEVRPFQIFLAAFLFFSENNSGHFKPIWEEVRVVTGSNKLKEAAEAHTPWEEILVQYQQVVEDFKRDIKTFYLY